MPGSEPTTGSESAVWTKSPAEANPPEATAGVLTSEQTPLQFYIYRECKRSTTRTHQSHTRKRGAGPHVLGLRFRELGAIGAPVSARTRVSASHSFPDFGRGNRRFNHRRRGSAPPVALYSLHDWADCLARIPENTRITSTPESWSVVWNQ